MRTALEILKDARIASPCPAKWEDMSGDDRRRYCAQCDKHVYSLADMKAEEALALLREGSGDVCMQIYRRADGTVLTTDCPAGYRACVARFWRGFVTAAGAIVALLALRSQWQAMEKSERTSGFERLGGCVMLPKDIDLHDD
jgi:hypothetical protein